MTGTCGRPERMETVQVTTSRPTGMLSTSRGRRAERNIKWVFNPIVSYEGSTPLTALYPGDSYVDWVAPDGYNWGALKWGWQSFTDIFDGSQRDQGGRSDKAPAIAEIGCTRNGQGRLGHRHLREGSSSGVRMLVWFEHNKGDGLAPVRGCKGRGSGKDCGNPAGLGQRRRLREGEVDARPLGRRQRRRCHGLAVTSVRSRTAR